MTTAESAGIPELYRRMRLIPSWDYERHAAPDIALCGLGGLGSTTLQLLVLLGIGERGRLTLIDDDRIEPSNRSRIPYARPTDDGEAKAEVAARYVTAMRPDREVRAVSTDLLDEEAQRAIASTDVLIGAVDSELARIAMNHLAYAFCLPYVDGGAGILVGGPDDDRWVMSGGQVRLVVPDVTPCLLCNLGVDQGTVDCEFMRREAQRDQREAAVLERSGYIRGLAGSEQPSAAHLNFLIGGALVAMLVQYLGDDMPDHHAVHLDLEEMEWLRSTATSRPHCAVCSRGELGHGRLFSLHDMAPALALPPEVAND